MTKNIKFSVTVPAYKAQFLAECIDSILAQTYKNFELIIVNDASPQDLDSIVSKYNDPRIRFYKNKVGFGAEHVVGNWNKCLEYATGDYIICMGDDDKLLPNCLEEYVKLIEKFPGLGLYHTQTVMINEQSEIVDVQPPRPVLESVYSMIYFRWFYNRPQYIGDWLFEVKHLKAYDGYVKLPYAWESDDMSAYMAAKDTGVANVQCPGFMYRRNSQTISSKTNNTAQKLLAHTKALAYYDEIFNKEPDNALDVFYRNKLIKSKGHHLEKGFRIDLVSDINANIFRYWHWMLRKNKYGISMNALNKSFIASFIYRFGKKL